ncbi:MAG: hypothetical protein COZ80_02620 [Ignavibacteria bacterium CG_4_8_14_3_um_filter_37_9]|nr:MAG: hypothetical protein AUJ54_09340 [Ignavibacteria bacterium CG1_02_37_35]PIW99965.1 MAG: hypothetical protein COZ80_02620 [Ignavibacteria bacterium CG_4_8_14_3_um_filter_37_9]PIX93688.1 MAG: hypothetical protein COZ25_09360 [Ignavibacteria bacterium CG_4_10_14_3_um_filter_37_18]PJC57181.1 MAG: hypothetical protein CO025_14690 [Ignavibacteria bacterium CG_4_9_14_0_2_um_filter_37_13]
MTCEKKLIFWLPFGEIKLLKHLNIITRWFAIQVCGINTLFKNKKPRLLGAKLYLNFHLQINWIGSKIVLFSLITKFIVLLSFHKIYVTIK